MDETERSRYDSHFSFFFTSFHRSDTDDNSSTCENLNTSPICFGSTIWIFFSSVDSHVNVNTSCLLVIHFFFLPLLLDKDSINIFHIFDGNNDNEHNNMITIITTAKSTTTEMKIIMMKMMMM